MSGANEPPFTPVTVDQCDICGSPAVVRMSLLDDTRMWMCRDCADLRYMENFDVD